jgi:hypothetical protein
MTARPQCPATCLITVGFDPHLDRTHHHHNPSESSALPKGDNGLLVNATFVRDPSIGRECSRTQQLTDASSPIERLHRMSK